MSSDRRVDRKGRVTIPKELRDRLGIEPGEEVTVDLSDDEIVIRPNVSRTAVIETLEGCIDDESRREDAQPLSPADVKADWTHDVPEATNDDPDSE